MIASSCITLINVIDGEDGISILSIDEQFSKSNSQDIVPTINWTDIFPQRNEGEILWKREVVTYSNYTIKYLNPHPITGDKGDVGESGEISIGLGYKVNHTSLASSNAGEIFAHGFNDGVAANINGWIYFESIRYTVLVGYLNPGSVYNIFPYSSYIGIRKSSPSKIVAIRFNTSTKTFLFVDSEDNYSGQVDETDWIIIGDFKMTNSEMIEYANFYNGGKSLQAIKEEELLKSGKLVIEWFGNKINIKALNSQGFVSFNGDRLYLQSKSKTFSIKGEGLIIANLNTGSVLFCKVELGETVYNNQSVKTINFLDFETSNLITTRHTVLVDYGYIKIGEFIIDELGIVKTASISEGEPLETYLQASFMKLFRMGDISISDFEDWLEALDLKNFYQTLVVSNLFVNKLTANDGQFLNSLRITSSNIEGILETDKIDRQSLFKSGLGLLNDGSIQGNWNGLDENGFPVSGWKIDGKGQAFFNGAKIIGADVKGITAEQIIHNALNTKDQSENQPINFSYDKNEWLADDYLELFDSNHINRSNYNISCDGLGFDYFLKTNDSNQYVMYDSNPYTTNISGGDYKALHTWTNTYGYPVFVEAKATLSGTNNLLRWAIINGSNPRILDLSDNVVYFVLFPNEILECRGWSWALWGSKDAYVNYVKFYKFFSSGRECFIELNNRLLVDIQESSTSETNATLVNIATNIVPSWVDYLYIFISSKSLNNNNNDTNSDFWLLTPGDSTATFKYKINDSNEIDISPYGGDYRHCNYFKIDCRNYKSNITVSLDAYLYGDSYRKSTTSGNKTKWNHSKLNIDLIDFGYSVYLEGNNERVVLFNKSRAEKKYFLKNSYYKNDMTISGIESFSYLTKINKSDFIKALYNSLGANLQNKWLVTDESKTNHLVIDNSPKVFNRILISSFSIQIVDGKGNIVTLIPDVRYNSLAIVAFFVANRESIETGDILPIKTNRIIGTAEKPYQSANINIVNATELHGKVYAS